MRTVWLAGLLLCSRLVAAYDPASMAAEFRRLGTQVGEGKQANVLAALPAVWEVATTSGPYTISSVPLRALLEKPAKESFYAKAWLEYMAAHLDGFSKTPGTHGNARAALDRILARREFAGIGPPSAWDLFKERVANWLASLLRRIFSMMGMDSASGAILFWVLLAAAVGALGFLLVRIWTRDERDAALTTAGRFAVVRTSLDWVRTARAAAQTGDWRRAIQCAYWAGVVRLEETGALPHNRTHTPREYLRLLALSSSAAPLAELTKRLERFWYAGSAAGADDFAACLDSLEALGCPVK
jgi:hypothetical protein